MDNEENTTKGCPIEAVLEQTKMVLEILTQILKHSEAMLKEKQDKGKKS